MRIFPSWPEISELRPSLTEGELALAKYLDQYLPPDWEIFLQPYMNGDRPDIVVLSPKLGIVVYEVKDWTPKLYSSFVEENPFAQSSSRRDSVEIQGKGTRKVRRFKVNTDQGQEDIPSPYGQARRYRDNLVNLYVPNIGQTLSMDRHIHSAFRVGLYFHKMSTEEARKLAPSQTSCFVFGHDLLNDGEKALGRIVPQLRRSDTAILEEEWHLSIRTWLKPPYHAIEQGMPIRLSEEQQRTARPSPRQHQRLKGVAGSGKTLVLAQRAANIAAEGMHVLLVTFNITLWHHIRDQVSRARQGFPWSRFTFKHFHGLCRDYYSENGIPWPNFSKDEAARYFNEIIPETIIRHMDVGKNEKSRIYDAVLIDEGQDYCLSWYMMLNKMLTENNELVFTADEKQNIYNRESRWIDGPMVGFRGPWRILRPSYRLPRKFIVEVNRFAEKFLSKDDSPKLEEPPNPEPAFLEPKLIWEDLSIGQPWKDTALSYVLWLVTEFKESPSDIVVLVPTHKEGWELAEEFESLGLKLNHVFEEEENENDQRYKTHKNKKSFWMGSPRLKLCTIHSFKGWELRNVILITPSGSSDRIGNIDRLFYTSMTRALENLIILNRSARYREYGDGWGKYGDRKTLPSREKLEAQFLRGSNLTLGNIDREYSSFEEARQAAEQTGRVLKRTENGGWKLKSLDSKPKA